MLTVGVLFSCFGPYHIARLKSAAKCCRVIGIEMSSNEGFTAYERTSAADGFERTTVYPSQWAGDQPPREVNARLRDVLDGLKLDALAVPGWHANFAMMGLSWCLERGVPAICMCESTKQDASRNQVKESVKRKIVRCFSAALVGGLNSADYIAELGMPRDKITFGHNIVDNDHFIAGSELARGRDSLERARLKLPERYFLVASRLIPKKNVQCVLTGFQEFSKHSQTRNWSLVIVGDGPQREEFKNSAAALGIADRVHFLGGQRYADMPTFYGLAEALLLTSVSEQWGLVVNEAMAAGLPVIVSDRCGCARDLVTSGMNGFVFDPFNPSELAQRMLHLAQNDELRRSMGAASRDRLATKAPVAAFGEGLLAAARIGIASRRPNRAPLLSRLCITALARRRGKTDVGPVKVDRRLVRL